MKKILCLILIISGCTSFNTSGPSHRQIASKKSIKKVVFGIQLSQKTIFSNGINSLTVSVQLKDIEGHLIKVNPYELILKADVEVEIGSFIESDGSYQTIITPKVKSQDFRFYIQWQGKISQIIDVETTLGPVKDKLLPLISNINSIKYSSGIFYTRKENFAEGQYEKFKLINRGKNRIVSKDDTVRTFDFDFNEQARQNISLTVKDNPTVYDSQTLLSHFMFFPRTYLPYVEQLESGPKVTLPTGEAIFFNRSNEIIDGVIEEGPIDSNYEIYKRHYAHLKYRGKGIVLRANATGKSPQLSASGTSSIDMENGIKHSGDVFIMNGTTGQKCRRPRTDFWSPKDENPILFKFPTDEEFDLYLRAKCGFGIPSLSSEEPTEIIQEEESMVEDIWNKCEKHSQPETCFSHETHLIKPIILRNKVNFSLTYQFLSKIKSEEEMILESISKKLDEIKSQMLLPKKWQSDFFKSKDFLQECSHQSKSLLDNPSSNNPKVNEFIQETISKNCVEINKAMIDIINNETSYFKNKVEDNFHWIVVNSKDSLITQCVKHAQSLIIETHFFHLYPVTYWPTFNMMCTQLESSPLYKKWHEEESLKSSDIIYQQLIDEIEMNAQAKAMICLNIHPNSTALERLKLKSQRDECLISQWDIIENQSLKEIKKGPLFTNHLVEGIMGRLEKDRRRIQLRMLKRHFP